jgi:hypothetical protein
MFAVRPGSAALPAQSKRRSPGLARGALASGQAELAEARHALPCTGAAQQRLATPKSIVGAEPNTIPSEAQQLRCARVLASHCRRVRAVMPDGLGRQPRFARPACVRKGRMRVMDNAFSPYTIEPLQIVSDLRKDLSSSWTREVADVR